MSSETITRNDLTAILNEVLPPTPSEYKKLLWTNPDTATAFAAQTITMDLTGYDEVEVWFNCWRNRPDTSQQFRVKKGTYGIATQGASTNTSSGINPFVVGSYIIVQDRPIYVTDTGVQFGTCTEGASNGTMYNADSSMIPAYIYGIKYERVAPPQYEPTNYSLDEQAIGTFIDGKTIYRKSKIYTFDGNAVYDNTFFANISLDNVVSQKVQVMSGTTYAQQGFYWSTSDYLRCWITLTNSPPTVAFNGATPSGTLVGAKILITIDYTKSTD